MVSHDRVALRRADHAVRQLVAHGRDTLVDPNAHPEQSQCLDEIADRRDRRQLLISQRSHIRSEAYGGAAGQRPIDFALSAKSWSVSPRTSWLPAA
jgi:hypothetical protein